MKKKILAIMLTVAMAVTSITACGGSSSSTNSGSNADAGSESESTSDASADSESKKNPNAKYKVGVCQLVQHPALDEATSGFNDALRDALGEDVDITVQNAAGDSATCATITNTFVNDGVDLIMANATPALQAAVASTGEIPIVGTSVTDYATALEIDDWTGKTGINVTGTSDLAPLAEQAAMLKDIFPASEYKNVGILYCTAEANSKYQADEIKKELTEMGYAVYDYTFSDTNDVASVTTNACQGSDVIYIPTDNTAASCTETIDSIARPAGIPIVAGEEGICKVCGTVTLSINYYDIGYAAGEIAASILKNGKDPKDIEIGFAKNVTKEFNPEICNALGINVPDDYKEIAKD